MIASIDTSNLIEQSLDNARTIAIVGLSPKSQRPSHQVAQYIMQAGYTIIPVNPGHDKILGLLCYADIDRVSHPVDVVCIFRRSEEVLPIVQAAIRIQAKVVWMQLGVINHEAAMLAEEAGLTVIMDKCMKIEHIKRNKNRT